MVGATGQLHALELTDGGDAPGRPVQVVRRRRTEYVWGGLRLVGSRLSCPWPPTVTRPTGAARPPRAASSPTTSTTRPPRRSRSTRCRAPTISAASGVGRRRGYAVGICALHRRRQRGARRRRGHERQHGRADRRPFGGRGRRPAGDRHARRRHGPRRGTRALPPARVPAAPGGELEVGRAPHLEAGPPRARPPRTDRPERRRQRVRRRAELVARHADALRRGRRRAPGGKRADGRAGYSSAAT